MKKIISLIMMFALLISQNVFSQSLNVWCNSTVDENNQLAYIRVKHDSNSNILSESDIIFYVKANAEKYKKNGAEKVAVELDSGILNEDNLASIIGEIDYINVIGSGNTHITNNAIISYSESVANEETTQTKSESTSNGRLNKILSMTITLLIISLVALFVAKRVKNKGM